MSITAEKVAAEICLSKGDRPCEADDLHRDGIRTQHCAHCQSTARAILSLLQQGEPEGFLSSVSRTLARSMREILKDIRPEMSVVDRVSLSTTLAVGAMLDLTPLLSASPLPPAPGAETGGELIECKRCRGWGNLGMGGRDGTCPDCGGDGKIKAEQPSSSRQAVLDEAKTALDDAHELIDGLRDLLDDDDLNQVAFHTLYITSGVPRVLEREEDDCCPALRRP